MAATPLRETALHTSSSGALSSLIRFEIEHLQRDNSGARRRAEIRRLEAVMMRLRDLEELGENILAAVAADKAGTGGSIAIPGFLRRY